MYNLAGVGGEKPKHLMSRPDLLICLLSLAEDDNVNYEEDNYVCMNFIIHFHYILAASAASTRLGCSLYTCNINKSMY